MWKYVFESFLKHLLAILITIILLYIVSLVVNLIGLGGLIILLGVLIVFSSAYHEGVYKYRSEKELRRKTLKQLLKIKLFILKQYTKENFNIDSFNKDVNEYKKLLEELSEHEDIENDYEYYEESLKDIIKQINTPYQSW